MKATKSPNATDLFEKALAETENQQYELRLYVAGLTPCSMRAIANVREICEANLKGRYDLKVIDLHLEPMLADGEQIIAAPTLIKRLPEPLRRIIGDLTDRERVLVGLDLKPKK